ncbi:MAG TPA: CGNR zinc finger domain-containing protein [Terrimesophilobacter sp.]|uniref:CGNR zinc finger domain-containing protein n=1 Tax=Terrimesophilobacter sp. TaxID=2906435 RepID=UPI002F91FC0B
MKETTTPRGTGQWLDSGDGQRWWFDSGALSLDFAYTGALNDGRAESGHWEKLQSPTDLGNWLADRFAHLDTTIGERELADALMLREAIARLALAARRPARPATSDVDVVNLFAATPDLPPVLAGGSRQAGASRARAMQALSTIARDAVRTFGPDAEGRIRACSADDCAIVYLDTSRSGNRRWCSMQRCGNRAKVRAHRSRSATRTG